MDLYGNWGVGLDSAVNDNDAGTETQLLAKWLEVIKGPRYQMSPRPPCCCQIYCRYGWITSKVVSPEYFFNWVQ